MPLPAMMMAPFLMRFSAMDSSAFWVVRRIGSRPLADLGRAGAAHVFTVDVGDLADVLQIEDIVGLGRHGAVEVDDLLRQPALPVEAPGG